MKALTLWQPWASLVICGAKRLETRRRRMHYRGPLAIHAGLKVAPEQLVEGTPLGQLCEELFGERWRKELPRGKVLGVTSVLECLSSDDAIARGLVTRQEAICGYFAPKRFAYVLGPIDRFSVPMAAHGFRGLWDWDPNFKWLRDEIEASAAAEATLYDDLPTWEKSDADPASLPAP